MSSFKPVKTGDKYIDFEQSIPFSRYEGALLFQKVIQAKEESLGGDGEDVTIDSLVRAFASNKEDKEQYEIIIDEL